MQVMLMAATASSPGLAAGLPAWAITLIGLGLIGLAAGLFYVVEKFNLGCLLVVAAIICGFAGVNFLWQGLFGG